MARPKSRITKEEWHFSQSCFEELNVCRMTFALQMALAITKTITWLKTTPEQGSHKADLWE
jgi:hypothetical protein